MAPCFRLRLRCWPLHGCTSKSVSSKRCQTFSGFRFSPSTTRKSATHKRIEALEERVPTPKQPSSSLPSCSGHFSICAWSVLRRRSILGLTYQRKVALELPVAEEESLGFRSLGRRRVGFRERQSAKLLADLQPSNPKPLNP